MSEESFEDDDEESEPTVDSLFEKFEKGASPGLKAANYDVPLIRDKGEGHPSLETIVSAIVNGCVFGKLCLYPSKDQRKWLYNAITLTDTFVVRIHRQDVFKMVDN